MRYFDSSPAAQATSLEPVNGAPLRERLLDELFRQIRVGSLAVRYPSGAWRDYTGAAPGPQARLMVHNPRLALRLMTGGDLGFAEGYMEGEWDTPDLTALLTLGAVNEAAMRGSLRPSLPARLLSRLIHACRANTRFGSRRNIAAHYDLGNEFFGAWLDDTMTYSAAIFADPAEDFAAAQLRKYRRLACKLDLQPGHRVLEIGCGWGGFAEVAARDFGCEIVGLTLSQEQAAFAQARMARVGLSDRVEIRLQDYRDVAGTFDRIASIEMFEAVGEANWPTYFGVVRDRLAPGGLAGLQVITIDEAAFESYRRNPDFIQRYIFPGGMLPSPAALSAAARDAGLRVEDTYWFGPSYAESLRRWDAAFRTAWPRIRPLGFDERFRRMWRYYLCYCEAGFDLGRTDVGQFLIRRP
jgi:cyclopropane-fatty-acyl-phospholipid synthase